MFTRRNNIGGKPYRWRARNAIKYAPVSDDITSLEKQIGQLDEKKGNNPFLQAGRCTSLNK